MLFSSITFLYFFLPVFLLCYFLAPKKYRNLVIVIFSLVFYAWGEPKYIFLMIAAIIVGYFSGVLIDKYRGGRRSKAVLCIAVVFILAVLGLFKYADFFIGNFNAVTGLSVPFLRIALPIGISFYSFQLISYLIDVYRGEPAQRDMLNLAAYITMFPQLIAGPIVRYTDVAAELRERTCSSESIALGVRRFVVGLAKKILLANVLGEVCAVFAASAERSVLFYWMYAIGFSLQVYFDFSGYSDMAIGLGRMMGFSFPENFEYPFISHSITEFWRRWHKTLGAWFRDYVYIPLGGNRTSKLRHVLNILIVWMLTGLWHGASWNFVIWGLFFAVFLIIEKYWLLDKFQKAKPLGHIYVLLLTSISFVIFNAADVSQAVADIGGMFGAGGIPFVSKEALYYLKSYGVVFILAIVGATPLLKKLIDRLGTKPAAGKVLAAAEPVVLIALLVLCTAYLIDGSYNPFLYFRF